MAKLLLQNQSPLGMKFKFSCSAISLGLTEVLKISLKMGVGARYLHPIGYYLYLWCTKRVKSTDTGRPF